MTENFKPVSRLNVLLDFGNKPVIVGELFYERRKIYFQYDADFLKKGLNISPFKLLYNPNIQSFSPSLFEGLPGVFNDSLPDGWGRLLLDRDWETNLPTFIE